MTNRIGVYELGKTLGEGNFGKVKFAINSETGEKFAVKILDKQKLVKNGMTNQIQKEIGILKMIRHRHIVNLKDVLVSKTKIFMILEYVPGGELFYKLAKEGRFDENLGRNYFQQLIAGVEYCHSRNICHRDLKPENLLVDDGNVLKISDFGLSALHSSEGNDANGSSKLLNTTCGTPNYIAPEVLSMNGYQGQPADLWSCGVILYVFLAGFLPFEDEKTEGLFKKIQKAQFKYPPWFSQGVKDLLNRILVVDPKKRYTIDRIKNHPWFKIGLEQNRNLRFGEENEGEGVRLGTSSSPPPRLLDLEDEKENNDLPTVNGIKITNAFDLISMSGAFDLTPMLVSPKKPSPISSGSVPSSSSSNPLNKVPSLTRLPTLNTPDNSTPLNLGLNNVTSVPRRNSDAIKRYTRFSSEADPDLILERLRVVLGSIPSVHYEQTKKFKVQVSAPCPTGPITFTIEVYVLAHNLYMVDFLKKKGDTLDFFKLFKQIQEGCADICKRTEGKEGITSSKEEIS